MLAGAERDELQCGRSRVHGRDGGEAEPVRAGGLRHAQAQRRREAAGRGAARGREQLARQAVHLCDVGAVEIARQLHRGAALDDLRVHGEAHAVAAGDDAAARLLHRRAHRRQARLRRVVGVVEAGLPARERGLVERVEEIQPLDVRLAEGELDRLAVVVRLHLLRHRLRRRRLGPGVEALLRRRNLRLDAELVVDDRQRRPRLGGAVEGGAEQRDELRVVGERDRRRVRVRAEERRDARVVLVRVEGEAVHDRRRPPARAVRRAEVADEPGRRVRRPAARSPPSCSSI